MQDRKRKLIEIMRQYIILRKRKKLEKENLTSLLSQIFWITEMSRRHPSDISANSTQDKNLDIHL